MPIANAKDMLLKATEEKCAVGAFNITRPQSSSKQWWKLPSASARRLLFRHLWHRQNF